MSHIGEKSSISNNRKRNTKCFSETFSSVNYVPVSQYYNFDCLETVISPCNKNKIHENLFIPLPVMMAKQTIPLKLSFLIYMINLIKAEVFISNTPHKNCDDICRINNMNCDENLFPLINNCQFSKHALFKNLDIKGCIKKDEGGDQPFIYNEMYRITIKEPPLCKKTIEFSNVIKVCICRK